MPGPRISMASRHIDIRVDEDFIAEDGNERMRPLSRRGARLEGPSALMAQTPLGVPRGPTCQRRDFQTLAIQLSTAVASLGMALERLRMPLAVTKTSSSMRAP